MNKFRTLRADEIDCRISQIKDNDGKATGLTLLLYKDARCDQNILDETVGPMNWQRHHTRDNRNCIVAIWDSEKNQWIEKEDTGTESNTEKEKGLASDSFKRACFNWGIGRELYTAPFVWIPANKCNIVLNKYKKLACYDTFTVTDIDYLNGNICYLSIKNEKTGKTCFEWGKKGELTERTVAPDSEPESGIIVPEPRANVTTVDKVPQPEGNPVKDYIEDGIRTMRVMFGDPDDDAALKRFTKYRKALIESGTIKDTKKITTLEEAQATFDAIWKTFRPSDGGNR